MFRRSILIQFLMFPMLFAVLLGLFKGLAPETYLQTNRNLVQFAFSVDPNFDAKINRIGAYFGFPDIITVRSGTASLISQDQIEDVVVNSVVSTAKTHKEKIILEENRKK